MSTVSSVIARLDFVRATGRNRWVAKCPAHDDHSPSLSVAEGRKGVLLRCFAGCETSAVVGALGLRFQDLFEQRSPRFVSRAYRTHAPIAKPKAIRGARWFEVAPHDDDPLWRFFVARAVEERAWRCEVEPEVLRDYADSDPRLALAIIDEAATALRLYARSEASA